MSGERFLMSNVYVALAGGLGNQLFQVAAGYVYSRKYDKNLVLDISKWSAHQGRCPDQYRNNIFSNFKYSTYHTRDVVGIYEKRFNYDPLPFIHGDVCLHGYFQSLKYFEEYKEDFINLLNLPDVSVDGEVAVHIRRGDYLQFANIHLVCDTKYFLHNMGKFQDGKINVFTDSPEHVREEFGNWMNIVKSDSELRDLTMMSQHDNIICSNSSFSWWASLLGKEKKKIIVPKIWFNNFQEHNDIYRNDFQISDV
jgi:hypothetical protein